MNYKLGLDMVKEMNTAGGPGGLFSYGGNSTGGHGGDVGNSDFYAPGDTRIPKIIGMRGNDPYEFIKKSKQKNNKNKKSKKNKIPIYRRTFIETLTSESTNEYNLNCVIYTSVPKYRQLITDILESHKINYEIEEDCTILEGTDNYLQTVLEKIQKITTADPFNNGDIVAMLGEMDMMNQKVSDDKISGGLAKHKTYENFFVKYGKKYDNKEDFLSDFIEKIKQGIEVELEHTTDKNIAREIATDHLWEDLDYYEKLSKIEKRRSNESVYRDR
jgi:uncharacterized protein YqgV (UPF0045/DUF77 family)